MCAPCWPTPRQKEPNVPQFESSGVYFPSSSSSCSLWPDLKQKSPEAVSWSQCPEQRGCLKILETPGRICSQGISSPDLQAWAAQTGLQSFSVSGSLNLLWTVPSVACYVEKIQSLFPHELPQRGGLCSAVGEGSLGHF